MKRSVAGDKYNGRNLKGPGIKYNYCWILKWEGGT